MKHSLVGLVLVIGLLAFPNQSTAATFMDVEISGPALEYVVLRDLNVRIKPDTKSKRIDGLKKGSTIKSPGRHQGWVAVYSEDGDPLGFAYKKFLLPVLSGALDAPVDGSASIAGDGSCRYSIKFDGRSEANAVLFKMADYVTDLKCSYDGSQITTRLFMFMTEGPMTKSKPSVHQIGMDLLALDLEDSYDEVFTTNVVYDHDKRQITFDGVTIAGYSGQPEVTELPAESVKDALKGAVKMALESWNDKTWKSLLETQ